MGGWLTPDTAVFSSPLDCRRIAIPGGLWFYVQGAIEELTKVYNWQDFGSASPEETAQYFMDALDQFTQSKCEFMQTVEQPTYNLINNESYSQSGQVWPITFGMLPSEAVGAKAIYVRVNMLHSTANQIIQFNKKNGDGLGYLIGTTASITHRHTTIIPLDEDGCEMRSLSANGTSVVLGVFLLGWWH